MQDCVSGFRLMASVGLDIRCDYSDVIDAINVAIQMIEEISWPHREARRDKFLQIIASGGAFRMEWQDNMVVGYASDELLTLLSAWNRET